MTDQLANDFCDYSIDKDSIENESLGNNQSTHSSSIGTTVKKAKYHHSDEKNKNARDLEGELIWLAVLLDARFKHYFQSESHHFNIFDFPPPDLSLSDSEYARFIQNHQFTFMERVAVVLAITPLLRPQLLDLFLTKNSTYDKRFTEFGGLLSVTGDFVPTIETLIFVLAESSLQLRMAVIEIFDAEAKIVQKHIFDIQAPEDILIKSPLKLNRAIINNFIKIHSEHVIQFGEKFPAQKIDTQLDWDDVVLHPLLLKQIREINTWVTHGETLTNDWGMGAKIRPGYRALFYGPPGTGKTMTACLLGKTTGQEVYKIDLSMVVSKYIGETEKNLSAVFDAAQNKGWILFFDEADALFGKRTETQNAHDRYANQEVAFLLQRIETFDGVVILSSNLKDNIDDAFARRFESMIYFTPPQKAERLEIWKKAISEKATLDSSISLERLAKEYELTGGSIINVVRHASISAISRGDNCIKAEDLQQGIAREYKKEGKKI